MDVKTENAGVDPIKVSVIANRLDAICREIGQTMLRTSRSPIFSEARDFVTGIFDAQSRLVAQTAYIPILLGALPYALRSISSRFAGDIEEGDVFILNDPYHGNNHPPDITIARPVFYQGRLRFWSVCKGHHADVGGGGVAGYNPGATSIWDECLRIPPVKLYSAGVLNQALMDTILLNVHLPFLVEGDLHCEVGACTRGERSIVALLDKYGPDLVDTAVEQLFDASERHLRSIIREMPDGCFEAERYIDHDGIDKDRMIRVKAAVRVDDDEITFDFSGSDPQARGYVNSTEPNTASSAYLALLLSVAPDVRFNEGALRVMHVIAPKGSIVNASEPAPVSCCTISSAQAIIEAIWLALSQSVPEKVDACWGRWCAPSSMGFNPRTGRFFGDIHFMSKGGGGASSGQDGWDHVGTVICAGGLRSPDPELHELVNPYTVLQYEYWPDSAGAGQWRGGLGVIYRWQVDADDIAVANFGGGNREATLPYGLQGGHPAPANQSRLRKGEEIIQIDAESFYHYDKGDIFEIYQSGGGGYGDPHKRSLEQVRADVENGLVSLEKAREDYGVVMDENTLAINEAASHALRGQ